MPKHARQSGDLVLNREEVLKRPEGERDQSELSFKIENAHVGMNQRHALLDLFGFPLKR